MSLEDSLFYNAARGVGLPDYALSVAPRGE